MLLLEQINRYFKDYVAEDGSGRLELTDDIPPIAGKLRTVKNQNGILFLTSMMFEVWKLGLLTGDIKAQFIRAYLTLEATTMIEPGLYARRCGDTLDQSHDNITAMIAAGVLLNISAHNMAIYQWGMSHLWNYNINEPEKYKIECQLLGMDIACSKMAVGEKLNPLYLSWLCGSFFIGNNGAEGNILAALRAEIIREFLKQDHTWDVKLILNTTLKKWEANCGPMFAQYDQYYQDKNHPILSISQ